MRVATAMLALSPSQQIFSNTFFSPLPSPLHTSPIPPALQNMSQHPNECARRALQQHWLAQRCVHAAQLFEQVWLFTALESADCFFPSNVLVCFHDKPVKLRHFRWGAPEEWDTSQVTNMQNAFCDWSNSAIGSRIKSGVPDVQHWNTYNVVNMKFLFARNQHFNVPLHRWNVSKVKNMVGMFDSCHCFNQPLNDWNVSNVVHADNMFRMCDSFNQPLDRWNTHSFRSTTFMFSDCPIFNQPLEQWNMHRVERANGMFRSCANFNQPLNGWKLFAHTQSSECDFMFQHCRKFNQPLDTWCMSHVQDFTAMFDGCYEFNQPLNAWTMHSARETRYMFRDCWIFNQSLENWMAAPAQELIDGCNMFHGCWSLVDPFRAQWQPLRTCFRKTDCMFGDCPNLNLDALATLCDSEHHLRLTTKLEPYRNDAAFALKPWKHPSRERRGRHVTAIDAATSTH